MPSSPHRCWCLVPGAAAAAAAGRPGPGFGSGVLRRGGAASAAQEQGWGWPQGAVSESPPARPRCTHRVASTTHGKRRCSILDGTENQNQTEKQPSFPRPDVPRVAAPLQRAGSRYRGGRQQQQHGAHAATALRTSCCSGTNGCRDTGHVKRTERRSVGIKVSPGIEFLPAQQAPRSKG